MGQFRAMIAYIGRLIRSVTNLFLIVMAGCITVVSRAVRTNAILFLADFLHACAEAAPFAILAVYTVVMMKPGHMAVFNAMRFDLSGYSCHRNTDKTGNRGKRSTFIEVIFCYQT